MEIKNLKVKIEKFKIKLVWIVDIIQYQQCISAIEKEAIQKSG